MIRAGSEVSGDHRDLNNTCEVRGNTSYYVSSQKLVISSLYPLHNERDVISESLVS